MRKKEKIYRIEKLADDHPARVYGSKYNVQELMRMDDGRIFYAGNGRFCKTKKEAEEWVKSRR